jgi:hypothetical protein
VFLARGLDEMGFEVLGEPRESAGEGSLMPSGNTDIHATENLFYDIRAFESAA